MCDISFDEVSVLKSLEKLRDDKAAGADELVPRFLNLIKQELACPLTILFQSIMACESVPDDWKKANVVPVYKGGSRNVATTLTIGRLVSPVSCARFLRRLLGIRLLSFWRLMHLLETPSMGLEKVDHA